MLVVSRLRWNNMLPDNRVYPATQASGQIKLLADALDVWSYKIFSGSIAVGMDWTQTLPK